MLDSSAPLFHTARYTDPQQVLEAIFGYREFRPGQRKIIDAVWKSGALESSMRSSLAGAG